MNRDTPSSITMAPHHDPEAPADLSSLAWVQEELRRTLDTAHKSLRRHLRDTESRHMELESSVSASLAQARNLIHQGVGALDMIGLTAAARYLRASEKVVQRLVTGDISLDADMVSTLERAAFALHDYLRRMLAGQAVPALAMFAQYRAVLALAGEQRIHPADLWAPVQALPAAPVTADAAPVSARVRMAIERRLLDYFRSGSPEAAGQISAQFARLAQGPQAGALERCWQLAAAVFEAQSAGLLKADVYTKRMASRLLASLRAAERGQAQSSDRLVQDMLFYCAAARPDPVAAPLLTQVRAQYGLDGVTTVDYETSPLGRFDPALIPVARRRVSALKESWSALSSGDPGVQTLLNEQAALVADSVKQLYGQGDALAQALVSAVAAAVGQSGAPRPALAMEVATSLLCIDASLDEIDLDQPVLQQRIQRLAQRLSVVAKGLPAEPVEPWVEALYRDVSDRQAMGSVVQELRASLAEVESQLDRFSRQPAERELLTPVPGQLSTMRGVMSVLGLDQAMQAVLRMRDDVDAALAQPDVAPDLANRLADNLGGLSFLIDMLGVQPELARSLFQFDADTGRFAAVMGRARAADSAAVVDPQLITQVQNLVQDAADHQVSDADLSRTLEDLSHQAVAADQSALAETAAQAVRALAKADNTEARDAARADAAQALSDFAAGSTRPAPLLSDTSAPDDDTDMRDIFIEEAQEVIEQAGTALDQLQVQPQDLSAMTALRRAFHTLKGSSRMVGLTEIGEAAWACEQLFNARLADAVIEADPALRAFTREALDQTDQWIQDLLAQDSVTLDPRALIEAANALRERAPVAHADRAPEPADTLTTLPPAVEPEALAPALPDLLALPELQDPLGLPTLPEMPVPLPPVPELDASVPDDLDLPDLPALLAPAEQEPTGFDLIADSPGAASQGVQDDLPIEDHLPAAASADLVSDAAEQADAGPQSTEAVAVPALDDWTRTVPDLPPLTRSESPAELELDLDLDLPLDVAVPLAAQASDVVGDAAAPVSDDADRYKIVGPLRIQIALFNIYLNEADEQSRRLNTELSEWQHELDQPVAETAEALAHSLAGNSSTVGYEALSSLARRLEHALGRSRSRGWGQPDEVRLYLDAAEEIRRLLHQFAAGFLKDVAPELNERFDAHEAGEAQLPTRPLLESLDDDSDELPLSADASSPAGGASLEDVSADFDDAGMTQLGELRYLPLEVGREAPQRGSGQAAATLDALSEDLESADAIDPELFEIFVEEGRELLPALAEHLRLWERDPTDMNAGVGAMRALHTLKGGARLAGAMRLGEMAHRLESALEQVTARGQADVTVLERLQSGADALMEEFLRLSPDAQDLGLSEEARAALDLADALGPLQASKLPLGAQDQLVAVDTAAAEAVAPPKGLPTAPPAAAAAEPTVPPVAGRADTGASRVDWAAIAALNSAATVSQEVSSPGMVAGSVRVRGPLLDRLVSHAGEVGIARARIGSEVGNMQGSLRELTDNLERLRRQLRDLELQAETQMASRIEAARQFRQAFDPLELDRFTRVQELTRMMAESVNDVGTVQRSLTQTLQTAEDQLAVQARLTRDMQDDLLRARMVEFDTLSDRLYRVVRQAAKDAGKQVRLNLSGGSIELDRSVLDRMAPAFEHLLRNAVAHGIEAPALREATGKSPVGNIEVLLRQSGNEVEVEVRDDGVGLDLVRIAERARRVGLLAQDAKPTEAELAGLIFTSGFSTADQVTELAGRGVGMDVVRAEVTAMGGRIETASASGQGTAFRMVLPLTTAVTQVVPLVCGDSLTAVPSTLVEIVRRVPAEEVRAAYRKGMLRHGDRDIPFFWLGSLLQQHLHGAVEGKTANIVIVRSAAQHVALHVGQILGNQEVVVKNLGPQLVRLPGLAGMSLLSTGQMVLIYNPVALATVYGADVRRRWLEQPAEQLEQMIQPSGAGGQMAAPLAPLVMVVDDSLTVRRVTQRLLRREGYRVVLAKDGLEALERLVDEKPSVMLCDIEMPRMDGFDLVRNLRGDPALADLPVVMITSRIAQKHRDHAAELGIEHYLGKPYDEDLLLSLVRDHAGTPATV